MLSAIEKVRLSARAHQGFRKAREEQWLQFYQYSADLGDVWYKPPSISFSIMELTVCQGTISKLCIISICLEKWNAQRSADGAREINHGGWWTYGTQ
ncbi:hypothetical protein BSKO_12910 [Bryopsis sp. KO-2023]|nr:hypothetical protein BSKO_12910 [Bryopsis sp. KO-2023]